MQNIDCCWNIGGYIWLMGFIILFTPSTIVSHLVEFVRNGNIFQQKFAIFL